MKLRLMAVILFAGASLSEAHLIDLTPGGYTDPNQFPRAQRLLSHQTFFDQALHNFPGQPDGWVSQFGAINGGEFFFTNLFELGNTPSASISWNFGQQPDHYWLTMVSVFGFNEEGTLISHIFGISFNQRFQSLGELVSVDNFTNIMSIAFYGRNLAPDTGSTLLLGIVGLLVIFASHSLVRKVKT